ncbi:MAG TPA: DUF2807 domain-containing protein [Gammaproteobacteria bacterium]|nr:DUF2807 domain-containing protein [Gammaproteobacteria bacterium]
MRQSQIVLLAAFAVVALGMILAAGIARVALSQIAPDTGSDRSTRGPGARTTRSFELESFRSIKVSGTWNVTVVQSAEWSVELSYPENVEDDLRVRVDGDRLVLSYESRGWNWRDDNQRRFTARISMPELTSAEVSGAAALAFSGFHGDRLAIGISGAGRVDGVDGRYDDLSLAVSGAGRVDIRGVAVVDANVSLSGAGHVVLNMDGGVLSGNISGAGRIDYHGTIREQRVDISGAGRVARAE